MQKTNQMLCLIVLLMLVAATCMVEAVKIQGGNDNGFNNRSCTGTVGSCRDAGGACQGAICKGGTCNGSHCGFSCPSRPHAGCDGDGLCIGDLCRGGTCDGDTCYENVTATPSRTTPGSGLANSGVNYSSQFEKKKIMVLVGFLLITVQQHEIRHAFS